MKNLTVTAKTALVSSLLALTLLASGGVVLNSVVKIIEKSSADSTLKSELNALATTIEAITPKNISDALDPLPPGQLAIVRNHSGLSLLNSFSKFPVNQSQTLGSLALNKISNVGFNHQEYWAIRTLIPGPDGSWEVVVAQNSQLTRLFTRQVIYLLFAFGTFLILLVWLGSLVLSRFVLRPVKLMRTRAEELIKNRENGSLPVSAADDEISKLGKTLNQLLGALHHSLNQQSQLIADVSHELRTPLAVLQARLQVAISAEERESNKEDLKRMLENSLYLSNMLNQILFLARNPNAAETQRCSAIEARTILLNSVDNMRLLASKKSISIDCSVDLTHSFEISTDGLERIITNLISNSLSNVEVGGAILITIAQTPLETLLTVEDSGKGFDPDFIPRALERFSRSDSSRSRETGGFGLGLSLVKAILDSCSGKIEINNLPGGTGARVAISLKTVAVTSHRNE